MKHSSSRTKGRTVSVTLRIVAIILAILFVVGVVGCTKNALARGDILGFQFESCFVLFMFTAITVLASYLLNESTDCAALKRCSIASMALAVMCLAGAASYYIICETPGSHSGDISLSIPYGILISGASLVMLFLLFHRFIRMKEELEDFV